MQVYRGLKNLLFSQIDPLFRNEDTSHLVYGKGTSYSTDRLYAEDYCKGMRLKWGWLLVYEFSPKNMFRVYESNFVDLDDFEKSMLIGGMEIPTKNLAEHLSKLGFDSAFFDYDGYDPHILLLEGCETSQLDLSGVFLYVERQDIVDALKPLKMQFDGEYFTVNLSQLKKIEDILKSFN